MASSPGWQQKLADNQQQFADKWINRPEFKAAYDALSNDAYVNALYKNAGIAGRGPAPLIIKLESAIRRTAGRSG